MHVPSKSQFFPHYIQQDNEGVGNTQPNHQLYLYTQIMQIIVDASNHVIQK
jgi:hypothetical protein